jgi:hypothetical protein
MEFQRTGQPSCRAGEGRVQTRPIRDRFLSDSTRIPRKTAFKGAKICISNQIKNRKNPYEYAE